MEANAPSLDDLLQLIPDGSPKKVLRFTLEELHLSSDDLPRVLYDAHRLSQALEILLCGGILTRERD